MKLAVFDFDDDLFGVAHLISPVSHLNLADRGRGSWFARFVWCRVHVIEVRDPLLGGYGTPFGRLRIVEALGPLLYGRVGEPECVYITSDCPDHAIG